MTQADDELTYLSARAFGREGVLESERVRLLVESGLTEAGAKTALHWLGMGVSVREAATFARNQVAPGKVASLTVDRAGAVMEAMPELFRAATSSSPSDAGAGDAQLEDLRSRLVEAHLARAAYPDPDFAKRMANVHAESVVNSWQELAVRDGWSRDQLLTRIEERAVIEEREVGITPVNSPSITNLAPVREVAGADPWAEIDKHLNIPSGPREVSEADARTLLYGTPKET